MQKSKALEMLNQGRIEELKELLRDEIYQDLLKKKPGAKQRYAAMKKYFGYVKTARTVCQKPAIVEYEGKNVTSFCNAYSLALTSEPCGGIELFTEDDGNYPNVCRLIKKEGKPEKIDICRVIAEAKSKGYKLIKSEVDDTPKFMMHYNGAYFKLGLVHATYGIIDDGREVDIYHNGDRVSPIIIENDIGICVVLPVRCDMDFIEENGITVIDA